MPTTPEILVARLEELGIDYNYHEHLPVYTVEQSQALRGDLPGGHCKNLFLKDKKGKIWLVVALEERPIDLKQLRHQIGSAHLSFGKAELLQQVLGIEPGTVTPLALINDTEKQVNVVLDEEMMQCELLNYHPLTNTATITIKSFDLLKFINACGHIHTILNFDAAV